MFNADWGYDPFQATRTPAYWKLDKPTIIGESPAIVGKYTLKQMVDGAYANGYAGIMPWSYNANDGYGTWDACKNELKAFRDAHSAMVDFTCGTNSVREISPKSLRIKTVPENVSNVAIYDIRGKRVWSGVPGDLTRSRPVMGNGVLLMQFRNRSGQVVEKHLSLRP
jgi:hypothetical protein